MCMGNFILKGDTSDKGEIVVYQPDEVTRLEVRVNEETVWLTQMQMAELFGRERTVITKHIRNIFAEQELDEKSNVQFLHFANSDKPIKLFSLDVIISVGYRVKSIQGIHFRQWANKILKEYLLRGYSVNSQTKNIHDRFLIVDDDVYHIGASLKDLGKKLFAFSKMKISKDVLL